MRPIAEKRVSFDVPFEERMNRFARLPLHCLFESFIELKAVTLERIPSITDCFSQSRTSVELFRRDGAKRLGSAVAVHLN